MADIKFECPHCSQLIEGDELLHGMEILCPSCDQNFVVSDRRSAPEPPPRQARFISSPPPTAAIQPPQAVSIDDFEEEHEVFEITPTIKAFLGQIVFGAILTPVVMGIVMLFAQLGINPWIFLSPLVISIYILFNVWLKTKTIRYRLTTQRFIERRGLIAKHVNELELYRASDVAVNQGFIQRMLGYGSVVILSHDDTTPTVLMIGISNPMEIKEVIRKYYRAARKREGVRATEFVHQA